MVRRRPPHSSYCLFFCMDGLRTAKPPRKFSLRLWTDQYFPLQSVVAFAVGFAVAVRLRQGKPMWVWVWPVAQVAISIALHKPRSVLQAFTAKVWQTYFNWDCGCSATLLQW